MIKVHQRTHRTVIIFATYLILISKTFAETLYVGDLEGIDSYPGTKGKPLRTTRIAEGFDADLVLMNEKYEIINTFINSMVGEELWKNI